MYMGIWIQPIFHFFFTNQLTAVAAPGTGWLDACLHFALRLRGIRPTWHSALRLSPTSVYDRQLRLDAAALSAASTRSFQRFWVLNGWKRTGCWPKESPAAPTSRRTSYSHGHFGLKPCDIKRNTSTHRGKDVPLQTFDHRHDQTNNLSESP
jgi:hypothetical protein